LIDRLVSAGLLLRQPDPEDRRKVLVMLTERGEAILETLSHVHRDELLRTAPELQSLLHFLISGESE
jgi:DNA-binding MarR family transcriptional regulator